MFTGVQILEPRVFDYMDGGDSRKFSTTRETYPRMLTPALSSTAIALTASGKISVPEERIADAERQLGCGQTRLHFLR